MFHLFAKAAVIGVLVSGASFVQAETYSVQLGGRNLGTISYQGGAEASLQSTLNNTPMGVFNGTFTATSQQSAVGQQYHSNSSSSRKSRQISVLIKDGRAIDTSVTPASEMTNLSNVGSVPVGVIDPVAAFGRFVSARGCPEAFRFYDGRRAILVSHERDSEVAGQLVCKMNYRVSDGPGHLSPLYIKNITVFLTYDVIGGQSLRKVVLSAAGFDLNLMRQD